MSLEGYTLSRSSASSSQTYTRTASSTQAYTRNSVQHRTLGQGVDELRDDQLSLTLADLEPFDQQSLQQQRSPPQGASTPAAASPALEHDCGVCCGPIKISRLETFGCGTHLFCRDCVTRGARTAVRAGKVPRCFHPDCRKELDALVAQRLLEPGDYELFLKQSLWMNQSIGACPKCRVPFSSSPRCDGTAQCPQCKHKFCADCGCPAHRGITCEAALKKKKEREQGANDEFVVIKDAEWQEAESKRGTQSCPRCRAPIVKADSESCSHMTCGQCRHEFCWSCSADRAVIYAHGNHYHFPGCPFHAPYSGPDDFLPDRCAKCKARGKACNPPGGYSQPLGICESLIGACTQWPMEMINRASCSSLRTHR